MEVFWITKPTRFDISTKGEIFYQGTLYKTRTRGESSYETSFQVWMELKKVQKQGRVGRTQEDYPTSEKYTSDVG